MRVKKIELIGFKSFADQSEIHLGEGVTCIVGPNGCGKSNVSDAIRWVLGERSAKLLRGTRMDDVIFSGTDLRKPFGLAEVSITLDNSDHRLPIEYDEVVFSRRLYRSGQSEYYLNRTLCRLKDILDLILDTGMGSNSYSMIEQGRVDAIIQADPDARRFLIEEAAGISKYKVKKEEALRKLERTEQNLLRIRDILAEVQKNIQYAERQDRRAERYKIQYEELKKLEIQKAFLELGEIHGEKNSLESRKNETLKGIETLKTQLAGLLKNKEEQQKLLQEITCQENAQAAACFELRSELRSVTEKQAFNSERLIEMEKRRVEVVKEREILSVSITQLEKEIETKSFERENRRRDFERAQEVFDRAEKQFSIIEARLKEKKRELEEVRDLLFQNASELAEIRNDQSRQKTLLEATERNQKRYSESLTKIEDGKKILQQRKITHEEALRETGDNVLKKGTSEEDLAAHLQEAKREVESLQARLTETTTQYQETKTRLKLLEELDEDAQATEKKILSSFSESPLSGKIVKSLRGVLTIEKGYETAVEAVLGSFAQGLIADDVDTARDLIQKMAESHLGPCGILIQSLSKPNGHLKHTPTISHPQVRRQIKEVVAVQEGMSALFAPLFEDVYVVEDFTPPDLHELLPLAQEVKLVTKQGVILGPEARIFFRNGRLTPDQGPFQRGAEIRLLKTTCERMGSEIEELRRSRAEGEKKIALIENDLAALNERESDLLIQKRSTESFLQGITDRLVILEEEIRITKFEMGESSNEAEEIQKRLSLCEEKIQDTQTKTEDLAARQKQSVLGLEEIQSEREAEIHRVSRFKALLENYEGQLETAKKNEAQLLQQIVNSKDRLARLTQENGELTRRLTEISSENMALEQKEGTLKKEQGEAEESLRSIQGRKAYQEGLLQSSSSQVTEKEAVLKELQGNFHQEELKSMDTSYREKSIYERLGQTYHVKLEELKIEDYTLPETEKEGLEPRIQTLKEKLEGFGPVNLLAVDEYEELKHRHDFLATQEKDLNEAKESLLEAIRKINRTTKTLFAETFARAQTLFQEYYQILFNGGHAELTLIEQEERDEAGVDIMVRPPGKKLQHISLLSGGEKALTAMALLFALFRIKPSPICVLDEVDAPLDEANVDRFLNVLRTFLDSTQFLIITHNRKTIAMGDYLYGVTMEESGVSKLVSVKVASQESASEAPAPAEVKTAGV